MEEQLPAPDPKLEARVEHAERLIAELRGQLLSLSALANSSTLAPQPAPGPGKELLERLERNEQAAADLKRDLLVLATAPAPAPVLMPVHPDKELLERILFSEKTAADLRQELTAHREQLRAFLEASVTREDLQRVEFKAVGAHAAADNVKAGLQDQAAVFAAVKKSVEAALADAQAVTGKLDARAAAMAELERSCRESLEEARLAGKAAAELRQAASAEAEKIRAEVAACAGKEDVDRLEQKAADAAAAADKALAEAAAAAQLVNTQAQATADRARAETRALTEKIRGEMRAYAEEAARAKAKTEETSRALAEMMAGVSGYTLKFTDVEHSCKLALAEMEGHLRELARRAGDEKYQAGLGESVKGLREKLGALEKAVFSGIGDLASRLTADEVLFRKIFTEAEERIRKNLEPELELVSRKFAEQNQKLDWLTQEYDVITKRRLRALEAKSASYDALMDRIRAEEAQKRLDANNI